MIELRVESYRGLRSDAIHYMLQNGRVFVAAEENRQGEFGRGQGSHRGTREPQIAEEQNFTWMDRFFREGLKWTPWAGLALPMGLCSGCRIQDHGFSSWKYSCGRSLVDRRMRRIPLLVMISVCTGCQDTGGMRFVADFNWQSPNASGQASVHCP